MSLYYRVIGEGKPVVLIHGFTVDHKLMEGCMEPVFDKANGFKRIYIDLPGMGKSNNITDIYTADKITQNVIDLIKHIIPEENFIIIGQSYGGYIARAIKSNMENRIDAIGLICPVIVAEQSKRSKIPSQITLKSEKNILNTLDRRTKKLFVENNVILSEYVLKRFKDEVISGIDKSNREVIKKIGLNYSLTYNPDEKIFTKPVIFFLGKHDSAVGYVDALNILDRYEKASVVLLENAGHSLQLEQPEVFTETFVQWIKQI